MAGGMGLFADEWNFRISLRPVSMVAEPVLEAGAGKQLIFHALHARWEGIDMYLRSLVNIVQRVMVTQALQNTVKSVRFSHKQ